MKNLLKNGRSSVLILTVCASSFFLFSACTEEKTESFSFAVVTDTHYKHTISETFVRPFAEEVQTTYPEVRFVAHVGDFAQDRKQSGPAYYENNLKFGLNDFINQVKKPLLIARGNHDVAEVYEKIALPFISTELEKVTHSKKTLETLYYSFDYGNSHFIFLDDFSL